MKRFGFLLGVIAITGGLGTFQAHGNPGVDPKQRIESLLLEKKYQEAIWVADEMEDASKKSELTATLRNMLRSTHYTFKLNPVNSTFSYTVDFKNGVKGIFKPDRWTFSWPPSWRYGNRRSAHAGIEIAAYEIDRLFRFNLVPMTIPFSITYSGSLQYFVKDTIDAQDSEDDYRDLAENAIALMTFDYLISNGDRIGLNGQKNWLFLEEEKRVIAIDHGMAFGRYKAFFSDYFESQYGTEPLPTLEIPFDPQTCSFGEGFSVRNLPERIQERFRNVSESEITSILRLGLDEGHLWKGVMKRFKAIRGCFLH